jgi:microcystin-dependent protein
MAWLVILGLICTAAAFPLAASADSDPFLGQIQVFPYNFAPQGWAQCDGQLLSISSNPALFSVLGTQYGGNGTSTFALPNLQGSMAIGAGQGAGLENILQGEQGGSTTVTILPSQIPSYTNNVPANSGSGSTVSPAGTYLAQPVTSNRQNIMAYSSTSNTTMGTISGGGLPVSIMPPYLALNYCIALTGIFPSRS